MNPINKNDISIEFSEKDKKEILEKAKKKKLGTIDYKEITEIMDKVIQDIFKI